MILIAVRKNGQITLPAKIREQARVKEGDLLEVELRGIEIVLTPKRVVDRSEVSINSSSQKLG
jgi:AbrB family looped-hinge helix DNA binding protein